MSGACGCCSSGVPIRALPSFTLLLVPQGLAPPLQVRAGSDRLSATAGFKVSLCARKLTGISNTPLQAMCWWRWRGGTARAMKQTRRCSARGERRGCGALGCAADGAVGDRTAAARSAGAQLSQAASTEAALPLTCTCCSYEEGANISDATVLLEVGRQLGLPDAELQAALG